MDDVKRIADSLAELVNLAKTVVEGIEFDREQRWEKELEQEYPDGEFAENEGETVDGEEQ